MRKKLSLFSLIIVTGIWVASSCGSEETPALKQGSYEINFVPAKTNAEFKTLTENPDNNMIRSLEQYDQLIASGKTPLVKLPADVQEDFRSGLVFHNNGVASLRFFIIKKMLKEADYHEVMAVFGLDSKDGFWGNASTNPSSRALDDGEGTDYKGYYCHQPKSCKKDSCCICTSNC